jgi:TonB family protein
MGRFPHLLTSLIAHGTLLAAMGQTRLTPSPSPAPKRTEFVPIELPPPPPPPPEPPAEPPKVEVPPPSMANRPPRPAPRLEPLTSPAAGVSEAAVELPESAPRTPVRLAGVSLSNADTAAESKPRVVTAAPAAGPPITPVSDLSRKPVAPRLDGSLRNNYPPELRRRGIEGEALVRVHLSEAGRVTRVEPVSQSDAAFATACRETLLGTEWGPPLDAGGRPVRTNLLYRCRFRVGS